MTCQARDSDVDLEAGGDADGRSDVLPVAIQTFAIGTSTSA